LRTGLEFLAAEPPLAHILLVEALAIARSGRLEHERSLVRFAEALYLPAAEPPGGEAISGETALLLAGGAASYLSGRVLTGEAERLPEGSRSSAPVSARALPGSQCTGHRRVTLSRSAQA
jgi:hypothetical protein